MAHNIKNSKFRRKRLGFSLVEVILAVALFGLFSVALVGLLLTSYDSNFQAQEKIKLFYMPKKVQRRFGQSGARPGIY